MQRSSGGCRTGSVACPAAQRVSLISHEASGTILRGGTLMKRILSFTCLAVLIVGITVAWSQSSQPKPYKVVFDLTSADPLDQRAVIRWINEISAVNPKTEMEVVMYGRGLDLVVSGKTTMVAEVNQAMNAAKARFNVCAIAMKNQQVDKSQLLPNVQIVPDGIGEIVAKQNAGWGYIKVGH
jgi:intracellular sulfur oxidation DsrE/DsrF family protein